MEQLKIKYPNIKEINLSNENDINKIIGIISKTNGLTVFKLPRKFYQQIDFNELIKKLPYDEIDICHLNSDYYIFVK